MSEQAPARLREKDSWLKRRFRLTATDVARIQTVYDSNASFWSKARATASLLGPWSIAKLPAIVEAEALGLNRVEAALDPNASTSDIEVCIQQLRAQRPDLARKADAKGNIIALLQGIQIAVPLAAVSFSGAAGFSFPIIIKAIASGYAAIPVAEVIRKIDYARLRKKIRIASQPAQPQRGPAAPASSPGEAHPPPQPEQRITNDMILNRLLDSSRSLPLLEEGVQYADAFDFNPSRPIDVLDAQLAVERNTLHATLNDMGIPSERIQNEVDMLESAEGDYYRQLVWRIIGLKAAAFAYHEDPIANNRQEIERALPSTTEVFRNYFPLNKFGDVNEYEFFWRMLGFGQEGRIGQREADVQGVELDPTVLAAMEKFATLRPMPKINGLNCVQAALFVTLFLHKERNLERLKKLQDIEVNGIIETLKVMNVTTTQESLLEQEWGQRLIVGLIQLKNMCAEYTVKHPTDIENQCQVVAACLRDYLSSIGQDAHFNADTFLVTHFNLREIMAQAQPQEVSATPTDGFGIPLEKYHPVVAKLKTIAVLQAQYSKLELDAMTGDEGTKIQEEIKKLQRDIQGLVSKEADRKTILDYLGQEAHELYSGTKPDIDFHNTMNTIATLTFGLKLALAGMEGESVSVNFKAITGQLQSAFDILYTQYADKEQVTVRDLLKAWLGETLYQQAIATG